MLPRRSMFLVALSTLVIALAGCSNDTKRNLPAPKTTTVAPGPTGATTSTSSTTTTFDPSITTASTTASTGGVRISRLTGPDSPVECNAPTMVEISWETRRATTVQILIDGLPAGDYKNGRHKELLPLPCDNAEHEFTVVASADGTTLRRHLRVTTKHT
jgi:ABC-type transport system substrate-binding protein